MNTKQPKILFQDRWKYSNSDKTQVRHDWAALLPDMASIRKGTRIFPFFQKIVGPLLISLDIEYNRASSSYRQCYRLTNLAYDSKERCESFSCAVLRTYPRSPYCIRPNEHKEGYIGAFENLKKNTRIPIVGPLTLDDIFNNYNNPVTDYPIIKDGKLMANLVGVSYAASPALIAAWAGELEKAREYLEWGCEVLREDAKPFGTKAEFRKHYERLITNPEYLRALVEENIEKGPYPEYGPAPTPSYIKQAPYQDIVGVRYQKLK